MQNKPGNSFQRANDLGSLATNQNRSGRLQPKDRNDFYTFSLSKRSSVSLALDALKANADLKLFRGDRALITASRQPGKRPEQISTTLDPGIYYLQVSSKGGKKGKTTYNLTAAATPTPIPITPPVVPPVTPPITPSPVPTPPKQGSFRISIRGFKVNNKTTDKEGEGDGRHDEVFLRTQVHSRNLTNGVFMSVSDRKSQAMGQMITRERQGAGSGTPDIFDTLVGDTTLGGLQTGDSFTGDTATPGMLISQVFGRSLTKIWEGDLVSGQNAAYITPTIWETDRVTEPGVFSGSEGRIPSQDLPIPPINPSLPSLPSFPFFPSLLPGFPSLPQPNTTGSNEFLNSLFNGSIPVTSLKPDQNALFQSGRQLFGNQALGIMSSVNGDDRPIGMTSNGNDYQFDPMVLPLTYEMADYISKNTFGSSERGRIELRYKDDSKLGGDYTLYLKVQPSSNLTY